MVSRSVSLPMKRLIKKAVIVLALLFLVVLLLDTVLMPWYVNEGGTVQVPEVTGRSEKDAAEILQMAGLSPKNGGVRPDSKYPSGFVIQQNPEAGAVVKRGRRVYLVFSGGEPKSTVPSLRGKTLRDARFALERNGFALGTIEYQASDEFPENTIIDQSIPAGSQVRRGSAVSVVVSSGHAGNLTAVPNVLGRSLGEAEQLLRKEGFQLGKVTFQTSSQYLPNTVLDQYPRAGILAAPGSSVDLFVAQATSGYPPTEN